MQTWRVTIHQENQDTVTTLTEADGWLSAVTQVWREQGLPVLAFAVHVERVTISALCPMHGDRRDSHIDRLDACRCTVVRNMR